MFAGRSTASAAAALLLGFLMLPAPVLMAQEDDELLDEEFELLEEEAEIVHSAARHAQRIELSPSSITVITREDIETSGADNLADLLWLVVGIEVSSDNPLYQSINGRMQHFSENQHFLFLVDGREINDDLAGVTLLSLQPIFLDDIERIEVISGPGSTLYGANALVGVISITTRSVPEKPEAWFKLSGGQPGAWLAGARASAVLGKWAVSVSGGFDQSKSFSTVERPGRAVGKLRTVAKGEISDRASLLFDVGYSHAAGAFATLLGNVGVDAHLVQPRLELTFEPFRLQLFYTGQVTDLSIDNNIMLGDTLIARFKPSTLAYGHVVDGDFQYNLPKFWDPLLVITGIRARGSWINSDDALSYDYATPGSESYHEPGVSWSEFRAGGFLHLELAPADWVSITAGGRVDYDTTAGLFVSPRLATIFKPVENQFLRLGVARSFRKPSFQESGLHPMLVFPESGPIQPDEQQDYLEFMARNIGNPDLEHEQMLAFEAGWRAIWIGGQLKTRLDVYVNRASNIIDFEIKPAFLPTGLPDLNMTSMRFDNDPEAKLVWGVEADVRYQPSNNIMLRAGWSYRDARTETTPKNLFLVGGRFKTEAGLLGSLYLVGRGEYLGTKIQNPAGLFSPSRRAHLPSVGIFIGRLGYRLRLGNEQKLEMGAKWYVPVDVENWRLQYHGRAGLIGPDGTTYGGEPLGPRVTFYLEGWF